MLGENAVFVVLQDTLTRGEQTLADTGGGNAVLDLRRRWRPVMEPQMRSEVENLTGRRVIGFMGDNHIDPTSLSRCSCSNPGLNEIRDTPLPTAVQ